MKPSKKRKASPTPVRPNVDVGKDEIPQVRKKLFEEFPKLFREQIGCCVDTRVSLETEDTCQPVFRRHRELPIAYKQEVERQLSDLENEGFLEKVSTNEYGTPLVVVKKQNELLCLQFTHLTQSLFIIDVGSIGAIHIIHLTTNN